MKHIVKILFITVLLFILNKDIFSQNNPPSPPSRGGENGKPVGGGAPIGGGTLILVIMGAGYLVYKVRKGNYKN